MSLEERVAVSEAHNKRTYEDINELYNLIREHMAKEERERKDLTKLISDISAQQRKQRSFVGGIIFTVSALWAVALAAIGWKF